MPSAMVKPGERAWGCHLRDWLISHRVSTWPPPSARGLSMGLPVGATRDYSSEHVSASAVDLGRDQMAGTAHHAPMKSQVRRAGHRPSRFRAAD
jgi:hypothetical protein